MGDPDADADNPVLKEEQDAQVSIIIVFFFFFGKHYLILSIMLLSVNNHLKCLRSKSFVDWKRITR